MSTSTTIKTSADPSSSTSNDRPFVQWQCKYIFCKINVQMKSFFIVSSEENDNEPTTTSGNF
jgi:hypothetical protein